MVDLTKGENSTHVSYPHVVIYKVDSCNKTIVVTNKGSLAPAIEHGTRDVLGNGVTDKEEVNCRA